MSNLSIKNVNIETIKKIIRENQQYLVSSTNPSVAYFIKTNNETINIYKNNTVLIQGLNPEIIANKYNLISPNLREKKEVRANSKKLQIIGCDETGVGDFFGPLVTCCAFVNNDFIIKYPELYKKLRDSKKIDDKNIYKIYDLIKDKVIYEIYIMDCFEYNELYNIYKNTHVLKAIAHNRTLIAFLKNNINLEYDKIVMDQFAGANNYFNYLKNQEKVMKSNMEFITKAEDKFVSVACASIIARYFFLRSIKKLEAKYNINIKLGANNDVKNLVNLYKQSKANDLANFLKLHFNSEIKK
ncbi:ribonuclease HIII [Spiroplasma helicoides]|uniref:Ribonuclease n=1 Tax=Spiroplasma helicoides TaxID=216938 RepID=A0A1B3SL53_9MOLU|nr:ribonuclease HIII [Spiroplasma helicoides]AOG60650.1 ribonuclease HIII [Spiroplasma helicoides]